MSTPRSSLCLPRVISSRAKWSASLVAATTLAFGACVTEPSEAGLSEEQIGQDRDSIRGGQESPITKPWMVALFVPSGESYAFSCGGVLYRKRYVVTAAHCVDAFGDNGIACIGAQNLEECGASERIALSVRQDTHPDWDTSDPNYLFAGFDIGVITLDREFNASAPLASPGQDPVAGNSVIAAGWGRTARNEPVSSALRYAVVPVVAKPECYSGRIGTQICTSSTQQGTCNGDSGGPLLWRDTVVGLTSAGSCSGSGPDLFTRVSVYKSLLDEFIALLEQ